MDNNAFKYFAFISYNEKDMNWGKRLQKKLEHYRMPTTLCSQHGWKRTPLSPVFFAPSDIRAGGLSEELQDRLQASQHLIVICSPHSAQSQWVGKEIEYFHSLGRTGNIHFFIVDGVPHSIDPATECFNPVVNTLGLPEILGANIHEQVYRWPWLNKERAYVQLVSKLLGVEFDTIWQRHKRLLVRRALLWTAAVLAVLAALFFVWRANQPFSTTMQLQEAQANTNLPAMHDAVVTLTLDNETKTDTLNTEGETLTFTNIPHRYLEQPVHLSVTCKDFLPLDTTLSLSQSHRLMLHRDPEVYGKLRFRLWNPDDEAPVAGVRLTLAGQTVNPDLEGWVSLDVPLPDQRPYYLFTATLPLVNDTLYAPCSPDAVILVR